MMKRFCDRCDKAIDPSDLEKACMGDIERWICPECANRLYHWFKMECHYYDCDEVNQ